MNVVLLIYTVEETLQIQSDQISHNIEAVIYHLD